MNAEKFFQAAEVLGREARRAEGMLAAAEVLREAGALEAHAVESEKRAAQAKKELEAAVAEAQQLRHDAAAARQSADVEAELLRKDAREACQSAVVEAKHEAKSILDKATAEAKRLVFEAKEEADVTRATGRKAKEEHEALITQRAGELEALAKEIEIKEAALADLGVKLERTREEARKIIGGA